MMPQRPLLQKETWGAADQPPAQFYTCGKLRVTLDSVAKMCPEAPRVNLEKYVPEILHNLEKRGMASEPMIELAIATAYAESRSFVPLPDFNSTERYKKRGFVQLAGLESYLIYSQALKIDLINQPELANTPTVAAAVLCEYLSRRLAKSA